MSERWVDLRCPRCGAVSYAPAGTTCSLRHRAVKMTQVSLPPPRKLGGDLSPARAERVKRRKARKAARPRQSETKGSA